MYVLVVGAGKVGQQLVRALGEHGHDVAVLEERGDVCERLAVQTQARVVCGDAADLSALERAGADRAHVVVACTGFDEENLVVCRLVKEFFQVPRIVARVNNPRNEQVFAALGIPEAISVTSLIAHLVEETATVGEMLNVHYLGKGKVEIIELELPASSRLVGHSVATAAANLPPDCLFVSIVRGDEVIVPRGDTVFRAGDTVMTLVAAGQDQPVRQALLR